MKKIPRVTVRDLQGSLRDELEERLHDEHVLHVDGIDQALVDRVYDESVRFFASPLRSRFAFGSFEVLGGEVEWTNDRGGYMSRNDVIPMFEIFFITEPDFVVDFPDLLAHYLERYGLEEWLEGRWPTHRDFPGLEVPFAECYRRSYALCSELFGPCVSQGLLTAHRYPSGSVGPWKVHEHEDAAYIVAFSPRGEPLEVFTEREGWFPASAQPGQALLAAPYTKHRVPNNPEIERHSLVFTYLTEPL